MTVTEEHAQPVPVFCDVFQGFSGRRFGRDAGAQNWAVIASLVETCKLNGIEPHGYLSGVLTAIAQGHKQTNIKELLPWNCAKPV